MAETIPLTKHGYVDPHYLDPYLKDAPETVPASSSLFVAMVNNPNLWNYHHIIFGRVGRKKPKPEQDPRIRTVISSRHNQVALRVRDHVKLHEDFPDGVELEMDDYALDAFGLESTAINNLAAASAGITAITNEEGLRGVEIFGMDVGTNEEQLTFFMERKPSYLEDVLSAEVVPFSIVTSAIWRISQRTVDAQLISVVKNRLEEDPFLLPTFMPGRNALNQSAIRLYGREVLGITTRAKNRLSLSI
jgi:hypothetical protein